MITFIVFTLSLLATTVVSQDVHTTFWTGYGSNDTFSNSDNWSNGAPTTESIAVINDTLCYGCNIYWEDEEIEVAELHLTLTQARSGPQLRLTNTNITVTGKLVIGSEGIYGYSILIELRDSELHLGPESDNWIYSVPNPIVVYDSDVYGRIVNNGTINIVSSGNTDYTQVRIGYDDSYPLTIDNWGFWKAEDELLGVVFYELESYNHYAGWYNSTFLKYDSTGSYYLPQATIEWEDSDFYVHSIDTDPNGSDAAAVEDDAVTDTFNGPVHFDSYYSNSGSSLGSDVKKVVIDAENVEFKWALFEGVNIVLNQDAWFTDSNFTDYANVNASTGAFTAYINGETVFYSSTQFSAVDGGELHVIITEEARVTNGFDTSSTLYIFGSTWFINNGTIEEFSTLYFYIDQQAWIINLGLVAVKESESIYFYASDFPSSAGDEIGKVVNRGTIQLVDSYLYWQETGDFLQCHNAVVKAAVGYPESTDYNYIKFSRAYLNGYFAAYIGKDFDLENSRQQAFTWDKDLASDNEGLYYGDVDGSSTFEEGSEDSLDGIQLCLDTDYGYAYIYSLLHASCSDAPWDYKTNFGGDDDVCKTQEVPEEIMNLIPRCPSSVSCGDLPTKTSGDGQPSSAILQTASLALLVTTLGFLVYQ